MATNGIFQLLSNDPIPDRICYAIECNIILKSDITLPTLEYKKYKLLIEDDLLMEEDFNICIIGCSSKIKLNSDFMIQYHNPRLCGKIFEKYTYMYTLYAHIKLNLYSAYTDGSTIKIYIKRKYGHNSQGYIDLLLISMPDFIVFKDKIYQILHNLLNGSSDICLLIADYVY